MQLHPKHCKLRHLYKSFLSRHKIIKSCILLYFCVLFSACTTPSIYDKAQSESKNLHNTQTAITEKAYDRPPAVITKNKAYVDTTPISLVHQPSWLNTPVSLHGTALPFNFLVDQTLTGTAVIVDYDHTVNPKKLISIDYEGQLKGALNELAARANYYYSFNIKKNTLSWSNFETKVFDISFMPGDTKYQLGENAGSLALSGSSSGSSGSSGSSSDSSSGSSFNFSQDTQYSNLTGSISIWKDLASTIKSLLSKDGKAEVSQSTTTVTVHDHPQNVKAIAHYINAMNDTLSRQVRIHVQLLEVKLGENYNYGINWDLVRNSNANQWSLTGSLASNAGQTSTFSPVGLMFSNSTAGSSWNGSNTIIQALEQQGEVSLITQPTVTTMNNQVATVSVQQQRAYLAGGSTTMNDNLSQSSIDTGTVVTGFNLYLLPKIQGEKVYLQLSSILSNLTAMRTFNVNTGAEGNASSNSSSSTDQPDNQNTPSTPNNTASNNTNSESNQNNNTTNNSNNQGTNNGPSVVQLPETALRSFNQRSIVPNGATLVLAGYIQRENSDSQSKFAKIALLGGKGATTQTVELVMLITPIILGDNENDLGPEKGYKTQLRG